MIQPDVNAGGLAVGAVLGDTYELVRLIGQGGMGTVWEASHLRLPGKRVAVKVLLATVSADSEAFQRFRREAEIASRLGHANIVEVIDFNVLPSGAPYLVLELLQGENLAARLRRGPMPPGEALAVARQIGAALSAAHRHGVVHRDLKPDNVFLSPPTDEGATVPRVKVLDFGISKIAGSSTLQTQEQRVMGTPQYMAPEQAKGQNSAVDARTDVFALGAIVYEMLSGVPAFSGDNLAEVVFKVVYEQPRPLAQLAPGAPTSVLSAIDRAMKKEANERFADVPTMIEALTGKPLATIDRGPPVDASAASAGAAAAKPKHDAYAHTVVSAKDAAYSATLPSGDVPLPTPVTVPGKKPSDPIVQVIKTPEPAPEFEPPPPPRRRPVLGYAALVAGVLGGGIAAYVATHRPAPIAAVVAASPPDAAPAPARVVAVVPEVVDAAVASAPAPAPVPDAAPAAATRPQKPVPAHPVVPAETDETKEDQGSARQFLDDAQAALAAGRTDEAVRLARRSFNEKHTVRAYSILTRAYCQQGDLGNAKAQLGHLPPRERQRVIRVCRRHGVELE